MKNPSAMAMPAAGGGGAESMETKDALPSSRSNAAQSNSNILRPLMNGCLTGQFHALLKYTYFLMDELMIDPMLSNTLSDLKRRNFKILRQGLVFGATYTTASLGVFEILTKKLEKTNNGIPLSLYQEACVGLTSGAAASFVWHPFHVANSRAAAAAAAGQNFRGRNLFKILTHIVRNEGILALWRGSNRITVYEMSRHMGMLASYSRSLNYLMESQKLPRWGAEIGAGIVSGFFAAACGCSCTYLQATKDVFQEQYRAGMKDVYRHLPRIISEILTPNSGLHFYTVFLRDYRQNAGFIMVQWMIFEEIKRIEEVMDS